MAKTRHQKLHAHMKQMAVSMNDFFNKLHMILNQVSEDYYWRFGQAGTHPVSQRTQVTSILVDSLAYNAFFSRQISVDTGSLKSTFYDLKNTTRTCHVVGISRIPFKDRNADFVQKSFYQNSKKR